MIKYKVVLTDADIRMILHAIDILKCEYSCMDEEKEVKNSELYLKELEDLEHKIYLNIVN